MLGDLGGSDEIRNWRRRYSPYTGAGIVERIVERVWHGSAEVYYKIKLLGQSGTLLMLPASVAEEIGMRCAIAPSDVAQLWGVLLGAPMILPDDPKLLQQALQDKLGTGDVYKVAEVVRDVAWRQSKTHVGATATRLYEDGVRLLVGEIAATRASPLPMLSHKSARDCASTSPQPRRCDASGAGGWWLQPTTNRGAPAANLAGWSLRPRACRLGRAA